MSALSHLPPRDLAPPCRSVSTGRFLPAGAVVADRLASLEAHLDAGFAALATFERLPAIPSGDLADLRALRTAYDAAWSAIEAAAADLDGLRALIGVADA